MDKKKKIAKKLRKIADELDSPVKQRPKTVTKAATRKISDEEQEAQALVREKYNLGQSLACQPTTEKQINDLLKKAKK